MNRIRIEFGHLSAAIALLTAGFLWHVEEAVSGDGLYLAVLWLTLGLLVCVRRWRSQAGSGFGLADAGIALIAIGHIVSTIAVFNAGGDRRAAVNLTLEWVALYAAWRVIRSVAFSSDAAARLLAVIGSMGIGLAAFGIWQHHVFYEENADWYQERRAILDAALNDPNGQRAAELADVYSEFQSAGIPIEGPERVLWENRLLSSREPFGPFVLANTLAGALAAAFVGMAGTLLAPRAREWTWPRRMLLGGLMAVVGWCLILTKSRSAWVGAGVGIVVLVMLGWRMALGKRLLQGCAVGAAVVAVAVSVAAWSGAIDQEVLSEAPKSLQFRMLYWLGSLRMLREHAVLGAGPGNFRQVYLPYRSAESSEEIRDPHNMLLDAWSSGGLLAFAGLGLWIVAVLVASWRNTQDAEDGASIPDRVNSRRSCSADDASSNRSGIVSGMLAGVIIHAVWEWTNGAVFDISEVAKLLLMTGVVASGFLPVLNSSVAVRRAGAAVVLAVVVHLLAAGGFQMPTMMLLMATGTAAVMSHDRGARAQRVIRAEDHSERQPGNGSTSQTSGALTWMSLLLDTAWCLAGLVITVWIGLIPVSRCVGFVQAGDDFWYRQSMLDSAERSYRQAAASDPLSALPRQRLAEVATYRLRDFCLLLTQHDSRRPSDDAESRLVDVCEQLLATAVDLCSELIVADQRNSSGFKLRSQAYALAGEAMRRRAPAKSGAWLESAVADQERVTQMNPAAVSEWVELLRLCQITDGSARRDRSESAAQRVLELDRINQAWGHRDQFLSPEVLAAAQAIVSE